MNPNAPTRRTMRLAVGLVMLLLGLSLTSVTAAEVTNQFLFLTLRLKGGVVTLEKAQIVNGTLKPQPDSSEPQPLVVNLEQTEGVAQWSLVINDPAVQRYEYEDPNQPGTLKSKLVPLDDTVFNVRTPLASGARYLAIYRKEEKSAAATASVSPTDKRLLARITLPEEVTR